MKLTKADKELLRMWGHPESDFPQIEEAAKASKTKYSLEDRKISRDEAISILGRKEYLSGISRSAFHCTAARSAGDGRVVLFDSYRLFERG